MKTQTDRDECLEQLWYMKEGGEDTIAKLQKVLSDNFSDDIFNELLDMDLIALDSKKEKVYLTEKGGIRARKIIRSHRIAERLISDVLQAEYENGACEFEHTMNPHLVDSICTLLGHPRECPHGRSIPEGNCCKRLEKTARMSAIPLSELKVGQTATIAYVQSKNDQQLHRLEGLLIRPDSKITLHQKYPSLVIECEGANIALGHEVAVNIRVWSNNGGLGAGK